MVERRATVTSMRRSECRRKLRSRARCAASNASGPVEPHAERGGLATVDRDDEQPVAFTAGLLDVAVGDNRRRRLPSARTRKERVLLIFEGVDEWAGVRRDLRGPATQRNRQPPRPLSAPHTPRFHAHVASLSRKEANSWSSGNISRRANSEPSPNQCYAAPFAHCAGHRRAGRPVP